MRVDTECTAIENVRGERPNPLFVPDCTCPACTRREAERLAEAPGWAPVNWLRSSGRSQRVRVENLALSERGHAALG